MMSLKQLNNTQKEYFIEKINRELSNQYNKFGNQQHSLEKWFIILSEEIGEVAKSINEMYDYNTAINLRNEIIQSITVLFQMFNRMRYNYDFKKVD